MLDAASVSRLFADEPRRVAVFLRFLRRGAVGVGIGVGRERAAHAWMATPGRARPTHIPPSVARRAHWIFFCATRPAFGGKGLYKFAQRVLIAEAFRHAIAPEILIDTSPDNVLSRRAVISTRFAEAGMLDCTYSWLPRVARLPLICRWERNAPHPAMPRGAA